MGANSTRSTLIIYFSLSVVFNFLIVLVFLKAARKCTLLTRCASATHSNSQLFLSLWLSYSKPTQWQILPENCFSQIPSKSRRQGTISYWSGPCMCSRKRGALNNWECFSQEMVSIAWYFGLKVVSARVSELPAWVFFPDVERVEWLNRWELRLKVWEGKKDKKN